MNLKQTIIKCVREYFMLNPNPEPGLTLFPHKHYTGYFINPATLDVYSIKSGTLKKMKTSFYKGDKWVSLSHKGQRKHHIVRYLKSSIDRNPKDSIKLPIKFG